MLRTGSFAKKRIWQPRKISILVLLIVFFVPQTGYAILGVGTNVGVGTGAQGNGQVRFGGTIATTLSCAGITPRSVLDFLGNATSTLFPNSPWAQAVDDLGDGNLGPALLGTVGELAQQEVPTSDGETRESTADTQENTKWQVFKENCLDKIVRDLAVRTMNRITISTVEWINGGFAKGGPMWISNPEQFQADIVREEFTAFGLTVNGLSTGQPGDFWPAIFTNVENAYRARFTNRMQNSFNQVLMNTNATYQDWILNFSVGGGWNSYFAFVQPNNNVFGSWIEANRQLNSRLNGTFAQAPALSIEQEIIANNGFLSSRECIATLFSNQNDGGYIKTNDPLHIPPGTPPITDIDQVPEAFIIYAVENNLNSSDQALVAFAEEYRLRSVCTQWEITTPGAFVRDSLSSALIDIPRDQLTSSKELNDNIGLLFDSLILASFNGISRAFNPDNPDNPLNEVAENPNFGNEFIINQGFNPYVDPGSTVTLSGGLGSVSIADAIANQQEYLDILNDAVNITNSIIQSIRSLDYCVPGPNPYWIVDSTDVLQASLAEASAFFGNSLQSQIFFAEQLSSITGLTIDGSVSGIVSFAQFETILSDIYTQYANNMNDLYPLNGNVPSMRVLAANYYQQKRETHIPNLSILADTINETTVALNQLIQYQSILASYPPDSPIIPAIEVQLQAIQNIASPAVIDATALSNENLENILSSIGQVVSECVAEVNNSNYSGALGRVEYPFPILQTVGSLDMSPFLDLSIGVNEESDIIVDIPNPDAVLNIDPISIQTFESILEVIY